MLHTSWEGLVKYARSSGERRRRRSRLRLLGAVLGAGAAVASAQVALAARVAVFDDPGYVDTANTKDSESDSVQAALRAMGHQVTTFRYVDDHSFAEALDGQKVLVIPELEKGWLPADLTQAASRSISSFVEAGGGLVIHATYSVPSHAPAVLWRVFGFSLSAALPGPGTYGLHPDAAATMFADGPAALGVVDGMVAITGGLPSNAKVIYGSDNQALVAMIPFGDGEIVYIGWDWFHGPPLGELDGGWGAVLTTAISGLAGPATSPAFPPSCGNGTVEGSEACDDGDANGTAASCCTAACTARPASAACADDGDSCTTDACDGAGACVHDLVDRDDDAICDHTDVCVNVDSLHDFSAEPSARVMLRSLLNPASKLSTLTLETEFALSPDTTFSSFDPIGDGVRIVVRSADGSKILVDRAIPGGSFLGAGSRGWKGYPSGAVWSYLDRTSAPLSGIKRVLIQRRGTVGAERIRVEVTGSGVSFPVGPEDAPLEAVVVLGDQSAAIAGACGESAFESGDCSFNSRASRLTCMR